MSDEEWSDDSVENSWEDSKAVKDSQTFHSYEILDESNIIKKQSEAIQLLSEDFGIDLAESQAYLIQSHWNTEKAIEKFISNPTQKLIPNSFESPDNCLTCFQPYSPSSKLSLSCGHSLCKSCFTLYLSESATQGPSCLETRCPVPGCPVLIPRNLFQALLNPLEYSKYLNFLLQSFTLNREEAKWCPGPNCQNAVLLLKHLKSPEIRCNCGHLWCFYCTKESHRPLSCESLAKWENRINSGGCDQWILANTKNCPKCKNFIEKNLGCMHMTCKCGHHFCWLCLGDWADHGANTGGYYSCNKFNQERAQGKYVDEEVKRLRATFDIRRFEHYYSRYVNHKASLKRAVYQKQLVQKRIDNILSKLKQNDGFSFVLEASELVYNSKKTLAYTYPVGYFLHSKKKIQFFEFIQGELEKNSLILEQLLDEDFEDFLVKIEETWVLNEKYLAYKNKVNTLILVIQKYFNECLVQIESGFPEVQPEGIDDEAAFESLDFEEVKFWVCSACTFTNGLNDDSCAACKSKRLRL